MRISPKFLLIVPLAMTLTVVEADTASADCAWDHYAEIDHWDLALVDVTVDGEPTEDEGDADAYQLSLRSGDAQHVLTVEDNHGDGSFEAAFRRVQSADVPQEYASLLADDGGEQ